MNAAVPEVLSTPRHLSLFLILSLILLASCPRPGAADDAEQAQSQLKELRNRIQAVQDALSESRSRESRLSAELGDVESRLSTTRRDLRRVRQQLDQQTAKLQQLRADQARQRQELDSQRGYLREQVRAAYILGRQEQLKLLLSQEDPQAAGRAMVYYRYLSTARARRIDAVETTLAALDRLAADIQATVTDLEQSRAQQQSLLASLKDQAHEREQVLARVRKDIRGRGNELARLQENAARLEKLLEQLRTALADVEQTVGVREPFGKLRNKLPWPAAGTLAARYGQQRGAGLKWQGVLIASPENQPVSAVSHGRVAFADWLRGFGLLIILDHGDGYMSLYGHSQALYREVGDWVNAGEVIASTGASGGADETGLYFELRHNGKPINPLKWCAGRPTALKTAQR